MSNSSIDVTTSYTNNNVTTTNNNLSNDNNSTNVSSNSSNDYDSTLVQYIVMRSDLVKVRYIR